MHIDIITERRRSYSFETYASSQLTTALQNNNVETRSIAMEDGNFSDYLLSLEVNPPHATIAFKDLFSLTSFWTRFSIPHLLWTRHSLVRAFPFFGKPFHTIACGNKIMAQTFNLWLLPPALEANHSNPLGDRPFDVVHFADLIDLERKHEMWRELFPPEDLRHLNQALRRCLENSSLHPIEATDNVVFAHEIEEYLLAERTLKFVENVSGYKLHLFGNHVGNNWLKRLDRNKIALHSSLPYSQACEVLLLSKIYLAAENDIWSFPALQHGALPLTSEPPEKIIYFLNRPEIRKEEVFSQFQQLRQEHSWEKRAEEIIEWAQKSR